MPARVTVTTGLIKNAPFDWPMVVTEDELMIVVSEDSLDLAAASASEAMTNLVMRSLGLSFEDALILCSLAMDLRISQVVDPKKTVRAVMPSPCRLGRPRQSWREIVPRGCFPGQDNTTVPLTVPRLKTKKWLNLSRLLNKTVPLKRDSLLGFCLGGYHPKQEELLWGKDHSLFIPCEISRGVRRPFHGPFSADNQAGTG